MAFLIAILFAVATTIFLSWGSMKEVGINLAAEFIFGSLVLGGSYLFARWNAQRKRVFFGVETRDRMDVFLSHIRVINSIGTDNVQRNYQGTTVTYGEYRAAGMFVSLMNNRLSVDGGQPLRNYFFSDAAVMVMPSPLDVYPQPHETGCVISFGSPGYNRVSEFIQSQAGVGAGFAPGNGSFQIDGMALPQDQEVHHAFIRKMRIAECTYFYVGGLSEVATVMAANYLATEWKDLNREFGISGFIAVINISGPRPRRVYGRRV